MVADLFAAATSRDAVANGAPFAATATERLLLDWWFRATSWRFANWSGSWSGERTASLTWMTARTTAITITRSSTTTKQNLVRIPLLCARLISRYQTILCYLPSAITIATTAVATTATSLRRCWTSIACHLNSQFSTVKHATVHSFKCIFSISFVVEPTQNEKLNIVYIFGEQPTRSFDHTWQRQSHDSLVCICLLEYKCRPLHRIVRRRVVGHPVSYGKLGYQPMNNNNNNNIINWNAQILYFFLFYNYDLWYLNKRQLDEKWANEKVVSYFPVATITIFHFRRHCKCVAYAWLLSAAAKKKCPP